MELPSMKAGIHGPRAGCLVFGQKIYLSMTPCEGFAGWISTGQSQINFIFEPFGYNYGFDIEWRCVLESVPDIRESAILESEIMILRGVKRGLAPNYIYYDFSQKVINWNQTRVEPIRTINNLMDPKLTDQAGFL